MSGAQKLKRMMEVKRVVATPSRLVKRYRNGKQVEIQLYKIEKLK